MTATHEPETRPGRTFALLAGLSLLTVLLAAAVGAWPTQVLAGIPGLVAMAVGLGIALVASLAGLVPLVLLPGRDAQARLNGLLTGMGLRFMLTLAPLLALLLTRRLAGLPLAMWTVIGYLLLLAVDTTGVVWARSRGSRTAP